MKKESKKAAFSWQIDNVSEWNDDKIYSDEIYSDYFTSGGCEWHLILCPKGSFEDDHLSLYLYASYPESLLPGWRRRANYRFVLLHQSGKVLLRTAGDQRSFSDEGPCWGYDRLLPHAKLKEEGFLENDKLTIEVYINVVEVIHEGNTNANEMATVHDFDALYSHVNPVGEMIAQDPYDIIEVMQAAYTNILLGLIETLRKPPQSLTETELSNADSDLKVLTEAGFKLDWLKSRLEEVALKRKKEAADLKVEKINSDADAGAGAAPRVASLGFRDCFIKRLFLSCFSLSNH
ncbi:unnamed protein product [Microthlaspi erraticum]|uniref:MATH domain-containing protein n=1 Tax=Microthlaspi erraticum TaxID=1685480 RepID=A0A6D2JDY8_9BRAS|nr:unnamed protein product [Microthlaspi erraticum]